MKFTVPEISWHNRDPVLSVDFQPKCEPNGPLRLATGGTDTHVLIWYLSTVKSGAVNLEVAADLTRHQKAVNVVRWAPSGQYLASGDDDSIIFVWNLKTDIETPNASNIEGEEEYKETWVIYKTLRGHMEDVLDISWSSNSLKLASGSVDNKLLLWEINRAKYTCILTDHKGFVQGVSWDPCGQYIASTSSDRVFRTFDIKTKKVVSRSSKVILPFPKEHPLHESRVRLYHDDTLQTYYRRLHFSPDGMFIAVPAGKIEPEQGKPDIKPINAVYIYTRHSLNVPACILPCGEPALVCRWSPVTYEIRTDGPAPAFPTMRRMVLAVANKRNIMLYDTQQKTPIGIISNIHYTRLTDLSWSPDGLTLVASSTDGFCSVVSFTDNELGKPAPIVETVPETNEGGEPMEIDVPSTAGSTDDKPQENAETPSKTTPKAKRKTATPKINPLTPKSKPTNRLTPKSKPSTPKSVTNTPKIDSFIKFKTPTEKEQASPKKRSKTTLTPRTPIKRDILEDVAMQSWSDNSNNEIKKITKDNKLTEQVIIEIEDSEDLKLVYEETMANKSSDETNTETKTNDKDNKSDVKNKKDVSKTPDDESGFLKKAKVTDVKNPVKTSAIASPKAPRRVNFVTLSSPKTKKKC